MIDELPFVTVKSETENISDPALMILGGRAPNIAWLSEMARGKELWAIDRGVDLCRAAGITPDMLIGDCDSATQEGWAWAQEQGVPIARYQSDKDLTDLQLALKIFGEKNRDSARKIFLTAAWGGRFDHLWSLLISFLNFSAPHIPFCICDEREGLVITERASDMRFTFAKRPKAVSLLSFSPVCLGVSISGVRWPLENVKLEYGFPYAISNRPEGASHVDLRFQEGRLGFYWVWND